MHKIRWGQAVVGALIAEATQVAAAFGWVAIYSYLINPGRDFSIYQAHAEVSGPWVSIVAGFPIFYFASRWLAKSVSTAFALWGVFFVMDLAILVVAADSPDTNLAWLAAASYATKLLACYLGGSHGARRTAASTA